MKKIISAVLAVTLCMGTFASCDKKGDKNSGGSLSTKGKSEYTAIIPLDGDKNAFADGIDIGIKNSINSAKNFQKKNGEDYSPYVIKFSGKNFVMLRKLNASNSSYYDGTFSVKNGTVNFSYENYIEPYNDTKINIGDDTEESRKTGAAINDMKKLNKTGAYCKLSVPPMNVSDKWTDFGVLPFIRYTRGSEMNMECSNTLKTVDDFLCTDTYGIKLKGSYKKGKDFKLEHNLIDTLTKDEQSPYRYEDDPEEWLEHTTERAIANYHYCDDLKSTIEFSDGEWEWYNADNDLINNGKYDESKKYPGLIMMYIDDDSEKCPDFAKYMFPLWFYIDNDGEIYYPAYIKIN